MTRSYDRDAKTYDFDVLTRLVEAGQATFFDGPGIFVLKTETGTVAVRPHQVTFTPTPIHITYVSPMDGYSCKEQYDLEDAGPGGVVYDSALALAEKWIAVCGKDIDPLVIVRRILDDEDRKYELDLQEDIDDTLRAGSAPKRRNGWVSATEAEELLNHFS